MMFRIIKTDGTVLGITDSVNYIKIGVSGSFAPTVKENAIGVAYDSTPYNLLGHEEIEGADTVLVSEIDGGQALKEIEDDIYNELAAAYEEGVESA